MFINEYNVLEECDPAANPETFIGEAQNLEAQGFQISFGCQSHFGNPVQVNVNHLLKPNHPDRRRDLTGPTSA